MTAHIDSALAVAALSAAERRTVERFVAALDSELGEDLLAVWLYDESPFTYSVHVYDPDWLRGRREVESFFIAEVDRDKLVLAGSTLE